MEGQQIISAKTSGVDLANIMIKDGVKRKFENAVLEILLRESRAQFIPDRDFVKFIHKAQITGADPTMGQIFLLPYSLKNKGTVGQIIFHYSFLETVAINVGGYEGYERETGPEEKFDPTTGEEKTVLMCTAVVKRNGVRYSYTAWYDEYVQKKQDGTPNKQWKSAPYMMIEKCALAGALRRAYPEALSGCYTSDETGFIKEEFEDEKEREIIEAELVEKREEMEEKIKVSDEKLADVEGFKGKLQKVKDIMKFLTDGYTQAQKASAMKAYLGVGSFKEMDSKSVEEVDKILSIISQVADQKNKELKNANAVNPEK